MTPETREFYENVEQSLAWADRIFGEQRRAEAAEHRAWRQHQWLEAYRRYLKERCDINAPDQAITDFYSEKGYGLPTL